MQRRENKDNSPGEMFSFEFDKSENFESSCCYKVQSQYGDQMKEKS